MSGQLMPGLSIDVPTINLQIRDFIMNQPDRQSLSLPPMSKRVRVAVHLLAEAYNLRSKSMGKGNDRHPVLSRTGRTAVFGADEGKIKSIIRAADGEVITGKRGQSKTSKLFRELQGTGGSKGGRGGEGARKGKNSEGAVVGHGAEKLGETNIGFQLLRQMGWVLDVGSLSTRAALILGLPALSVLR